MKVLWQHVVLVLGLATLIVVGLAVIPDHAYTKIGAAISIVTADPLGTVGALVAIAAAIGSAVAAYRRALHTPAPSVGTTATRSSGAPRS